ncbi:MAG TPA: hypothetical protein VGF92_18045 [Stellaceae bacterium]
MLLQMAGDDTELAGESVESRGQARDAEIDIARCGCHRDRLGGVERHELSLQSLGDEIAALDGNDGDGAR